MGDVVMQKKPWDWYKAILSDMIDQATNNVFLELRHGQPVYLYFKPTDGKTWGEFETIRDGQTVPSGFQLVNTKPFRGDKTKAQIRYWINECARNLPLIPND